MTVSVADRLLPLMLVSPDQITAQLPSDLAEGDYSISVRWDSGQVVGAPFAVARTAPGLFALAAHADGSAVTGDAPARAGETLTVYGSGLGPYERPVLDGFAVPEGSSNPVKDKVEVLLAGRSLPAVSAVATTGKVGVATIRFKLPDDVTGPSDLAIRIGDKQSNTVSVPIQ